MDWNTPLLDFRGDASYRSDRDELGQTKLTGGAGSVRAQTNLLNFPILYVASNWAKNVNDLDLIGYDTRTRTYSAGGTYSTNRLFANYEYSDLQTRNVETGIDRTTRSHTGNAEFTKSFAKSLFNFQSSYQVSSRKEMDNSQITGAVLLSLQAAADFIFRILLRTLTNWKIPRRSWTGCWEYRQDRVTIWSTERRTTLDWISECR
jgi:hypothetical protein